MYIHKPNYPKKKKNKSTYTNTNLTQPYQHKAKLKLKKILELRSGIIFNKNTKEHKPR